uniref:Cytochrome c oxidase subunit 4 n=1 Tax=Megaselia scalaris TaxID=36166 RepID=T1GFW0_MEGSC
MLAFRLISYSVKKQGFPILLQSYRLGSTHQYLKIGNREVVGYGFNGEPCYQDRVDYPFPSIRFREDNPDICKIREKERCDWNNLTKDEKKKLYRHSFCQTFAEMKASTGEWKRCVGYTMMIVSLGIWFMVFMNVFIYDPLPETFDEDRQKAQLKRIIDLEVNPIRGIASKNT